MLASAPTGNTSGEATIPASNIRLEAMRHPRIASHFVSAQVRSFDAGNRAAALAWIEAPQTSL